MQDIQLSQIERAAGCASFGQKWKTGTGRQYFTDIIGQSSTMGHNWPAKLSNSVKNCKIRAITPFNIIQGHQSRYQSKASYCFLLVINSNCHPISYRFGVIAAYCSYYGHCVFEPPPLGA